MELPGWAPKETDASVPNAARMYDYALGGYHNFAVDRELVERAEAAVPGARMTAAVNRAFLTRAVRWLAEAGVRQFLDIGSGIPTHGPVHQVARAIAPDSRVVYVDIDPVAVSHSELILSDDPLSASIEADLRNPEGILTDARVMDLFDLSQPVAVLLVAVLHFIPDSDRPAEIVRRYCSGLVSGSYVAVSHGSPLERKAEDAETIRRLYENTPTHLYLRSRDQVAAVLGELELVEPGLVPAVEWHPVPEIEGSPVEAGILAAVGRVS